MKRPKHKLIGEAPDFLQVLDDISAVAPLNKPVLIIGERGTGKELLASRLHYLSKRWQESFVTINCAAFAESILESSLFGHEAGAFTGASRQHKGIFERANAGTLFLDELSNMSLRVQEKLLRIIEYGEYERIGSETTLHTDVRIIGAANQDLPALASKHEFRQDLLDRLSFDVITLPPLRHRKEDILPLAEHFATHMVKELQRDYWRGFSDEIITQLESYNWPGNIRELKNVIERAVYQTPGNLPVTTINLDPFESPYRPVTKEADTHKTDADQTSYAKEKETRSVNIPVDFRAHIRNYESRILRQALEKHQFNQKKTATSLGLSYNQWRGYVRKYGNDISNNASP